MNDLISRCELFNQLATVQTLGEAYAVIQGMPTVDIVWCKDCKYMAHDPIFNQSWCEHPRKTKEVTDTYFCGCGYAERKDDENR